MKRRPSKKKKGSIEKKINDDMNQTLNVINQIEQTVEETEIKSKRTSYKSQSKRSIQKQQSEDSGNTADDEEDHTSKNIPVNPEPKISIEEEKEKITPLQKRYAQRQDTAIIDDADFDNDSDEIICLSETESPCEMDIGTSLSPLGISEDLKEKVNYEAEEERTG